MHYLLLILLLFLFNNSEASGGANLTFPTEFKRLKDEPFGSVKKSNGNKVFLKNRLLENLNTFFNDKSESLEMLDSKSTFEEDISMKTKPTDLPPMKFGFGRGSAKLFETTTGAPIMTSVEPNIQKNEDGPVEKTRSEGRMSDSELDTIREWRKRLYKAFKGKNLKEPRRKIKKLEPKEEVVVDKVEEVSRADNEMLQFNDVTPLIVDKNRQVILSRKSPNWNLKGTKQSDSFERDPTGKIVAFGTEPSGYKHPQFMLGAPSQVPRSLPDPREIRQTSFRTPSHQQMAFVPAPVTTNDFSNFQGTNPVMNSFPSTNSANPFPVNNPYPPPTQTLYPPPRLSAFPTGPGPRMPDYNLPAMPKAPDYPAGPAPRLPEYQPLPQLPHYEIATATAAPVYLPLPTTPIQLLAEYNTPQPPQQQYNKYPDPIIPFQPSAVYQPSYSTQWPDTTQRTTTEAPLDEDEMQDETEMFGPPLAASNDCSSGGNSCDVMISDEKCNSNRLRTIIQNNIVTNDAEASKRAVQLAAEEETGSYFNAICGTGFFSYIAHTDEFCLASSMGVNCYVFSPVCSNDNQNSFFARKRRKNRSRKRLLNKN